MIVVNIAAHIATLVLIFECKGKPTDQKYNDLEERATLLRKVSYEYGTLGSVFVQSVSGSFNMFDSYMAFLAGTTMVFNAAYNALELLHKGKHPSFPISHAISQIRISSQ
tara:strand:+ start:3300 stop:3629 length:330 start_codon:yes stop_codon:yes gene_type:complete